MLKLPDNLSINPGPNPVARVVPVLSVDSIGSALQELNARATQFVKGQEYIAQILSKVDDKAYLVKVDNAVLKMDLGNAAQVGQSLLLRYMEDSPVPTFLLAPQASRLPETSAELSPAAHLIGQYLKEAENAGVSNRYEAHVVVTHSPKSPHVIAQDLRQAVSNSGLFYESHLSEMVQGSRTLTALMQEPQNQGGAQVANLMSQQLAILENQRLSWHGEVWIGQKMDWDVYVQEHPHSEREEKNSNNTQPMQARPVVSEMTLDFPHLGKVTAKLNLVDGHVRINMLAEQTPTLDTFKSQSKSLMQAIADSGLQLDALTVAQYE